MEIREAVIGDEEGIARVHVDSWRTTYKGIVSDEYLNQLSVEQRTENWRRGIGNNSLYVAVEDGEIVGFATGGKERTGNYSADCELFAIYLLQKVQGKGIGKQLMQVVAMDLKKQGSTKMLVWVLDLNPAKKFYEAVGGQRVGETKIEIGGESFKEIAYVWDLEKFVNK